MRVIDLNRKPGEAVPAYRPMPERAACDSPPWVKAREKACAACDRQAVHGFEERCGLRPEWGCLGKARHIQKLECPGGKWPKAVNLTGHSANSDVMTAHLDLAPA